MSDRLRQPLGVLLVFEHGEHADQASDNRTCEKHSCENVAISRLMSSMFWAVLSAVSYLQTSEILATCNHFAYHDDDVANATQIIKQSYQYHFKGTPSLYQHNFQIQGISGTRRHAIF